MESVTINKYAMQSDYTTGTAIVNNSIGYDAASCWRCGNVVYADLRTYTTTSTTAHFESSTIAFTLPQGFRPPHEFNAIGIMSTKMIESLDDYKLITFHFWPNGTVTPGSRGDFTQLWATAMFPII